MEKVIHTTRRSQKQLCIQFVVREKIYTQVIQQIIVYTNCTHSSARHQPYA
jgi:hypothetical protein